MIGSGMGLVIVAGAGSLAAMGCGTSGEKSAEAAEPVAAAGYPDSMVFTGPEGITVWFTDAREAVGPDGTPCIERALEIRTDTSRRTVPLLYTREAPTALEDTTMRAVFSQSCQPAGTYRVDYAFARPRRLLP